MGKNYLGKIPIRHRIAFRPNSSRMSMISLLLGFLFCFDSHADDGDTSESSSTVSPVSEPVPQRVPLNVSVPDSLKDGLSKEEAELIDMIARIASTNLSYYETYPFSLPRSQFNSVSFADGLVREDDLKLFPENDGSKELYSLAFDREGKRIPLSAEQWSDIRRKGGFSVASQAVPGTFHRWELSGLLQNGTVPTFNSFDNGVRWGLSRLAVDVPNRLFFHRDFKVKH